MNGAIMTTAGRTKTCRCLCSLLIACFFPGCDESLPPRNSPQHFLLSDMSVSTGEVFIDPGQPLPITLTGSFYVTVENTYTEVLQETVGVDLEIDVWLKDHPEARTVVRSGQRDMLNPWIIQGGLATLEPGVQAQFLTQWNQKTDGEKWFWCYSDGFQHIVPPQGFAYFLSSPLRFEARARVQFFKYVQAEETNPIEFDLRYRIYANPIPSCGEFLIEQNTAPSLTQSTPL
jgi:hypothetical protein